MVGSSQNGPNVKKPTALFPQPKAGETLQQLSVQSASVFDMWLFQTEREKRKRKTKRAERERERL